MSNMSYIRFENTIKDLEDCEYHLLDECSPREQEHRKDLIKVCQDIVDKSDLLPEKLITQL